jgi:predicted MFS family arabinose efflux permease
MLRATPRLSPRPVYIAFAAFGGLWGTWGAALPAVRDAAGVSEGQLGAALLCIGLGALPAMLLAGRAVDRFGGRAVAVALVLMASTGVLVATVARSPVSLAALLLLLGATSGAADVGENAAAGAAERAAGRPVVTRAHGVFSTGVVVSSLLTGGMEAAGLPVVVPFALVVVASLVAAGALWRLRLTAGGGEPRRVAAPRRSRAMPLVVTGLIAALALAVENAHQSWGAVFLGDELSVPAGVAALAPAVFAGVTAATRFVAGASERLPAGPLLTGGAVAAAAGSVLFASSSAPGTALAGLALAAVGTSVLFPTLLRESLRNVPAEVRGRSTSTVATTAYLGFVLGPVYVGTLADAAGLRAAILGVAGLAAVTALLAWPVARWAGRAAAGRAEEDVSPARRPRRPVPPT